jgi:hypothetical protein
MIHGKMGDVGRHLEALWAAGTMNGLSDAQLLGRFAQNRDAAGELAFRSWSGATARWSWASAARSCAMPMMPTTPSIRKAPTIGTGGSLGTWLYTVACRTARRARRRTSRHRPDGGAEIAAVEQDARQVAGSLPDRVP